MLNYKVFFVLLLFSVNTAFAVNVLLVNHSHSPIYTLTEDTLTKDSIENETYIVSTFYDYIEDPLVVTNEARTTRLGTKVDGISSLHYGIGYQTSSRFLVGVSSFAAKVNLPNNTSEYAMGDTKVIGKYRLTGQYAKTSFALIPELFLPTGKESLFISDGGVGSGIKAAVERDFGFFKVNANLGYTFSPSAKYLDLDYRHKILAAIGAYMPLGDKYGVSIEGTMSRAFPLNGHQNPGEVFFGGRYIRNNAMAINAGVSIGNLNSHSSSDFRILVGVKFIPVMRKQTFEIETNFTKKEEEIIKRMVEIHDEIRFLHDSSTLSDRGEVALNKIAGMLKDDNANFSKVIVEGHTNYIGTETYNQDLSERRASIVREYLLSEGVKIDLLDSVGFGESKPKDIADLAQRREFDRRVEFQVIK